MVMRIFRPFLTLHKYFNFLKTRMGKFLLSNVLKKLNILKKIITMKTYNVPHMQQPIFNKTYHRIAIKKITSSKT